jgi:hypothetical protein
MRFFSFLDFLFTNETKKTPEQAKQSEPTTPKPTTPKQSEPTTPKPTTTKQSELTKPKPIETPEQTTPKTTTPKPTTPKPTINSNVPSKETSNNTATNTNKPSTSKWTKVKSIIQSSNSTRKNQMKVSYKRCYNTLTKKQRIREPDNKCELSETAYNCTMPTIFTIPSCFETPAIDFVSINTINEFWNIQSKYKSPYQYSKDSQLIKDPGPIQIQVVKYIETIQCLHDKVANSLSGQKMSWHYNYIGPVILLKYSKERTTSKISNWFKSSSSSDSGYFSSAGGYSDIEVAKYNTYLSSGYKSGIESDYKTIEGYHTRFKNYTQVLTKFINKINGKGFMGKINDTLRFTPRADVNFELTFPSIITKFNPTNYTLTNMISDKEHDDTFIPITNQVNDVKAQNKESKDKLDSIKAQITTILTPIRDELYIAFSLYILFGVKDVASDLQKIPVIIKKINEIYTHFDVWYQRVQEIESNNIKKGKSVPDFSNDKLFDNNFKKFNKEIINKINGIISEFNASMETWKSNYIKVLSKYTNGVKEVYDSIIDPYFKLITIFYESLKYTGFKYIEGTGSNDPPLVVTSFYDMWNKWITTEISDNKIPKFNVFKKKDPTKKEITNEYLEPEPNSFIEVDLESMGKIDALLKSIMNDNVNEEHEKVKNDYKNKNRIEYYIQCTRFISMEYYKTRPDFDPNYNALNKHNWKFKIDNEDIPGPFCENSVVSNVVSAVKKFSSYTSKTASNVSRPLVTNSSELLGRTLTGNKGLGDFIEDKLDENRQLIDADNKKRNTQEQKTPRFEYKEGGGRKSRKNKYSKNRGH